MQGPGGGQWLGRTEEFRSRWERIIQEKKVPGMIRFAFRRPSSFHEPAKGAWVLDGKVECMLITEG